MSATDSPVFEQSDQPDAGGNSPMAYFGNGLMHASVFCDMVTTNGVQRARYSVAFAKRYRDRETGEWCSSDSLFPGDIPNAIRCLERALQFVEREQDSQR